MPVYPATWRLKPCFLSTPPGGPPETRELLLDYLPAQSVQRLYVYFRRPRRALHVQAETLFYRLD